MNEHEALQVLLVKSFETQGTDRPLLADAQRRHATLAALEKVGARGTAEAFVAARATVAMDSVTAQAPLTEKLLAAQGWHTTQLLLAIGVGLLLGVTADVFGSGRELNLLAPPAWLVIVWNLGVYAVLFARMFGAGAVTAPPRTGLIARGARALMELPFRRSTWAVAPCAGQTSALADFGAAWTRASLPLTTARMATLLHAASAAVAVALIAGMYLRGIALEYRVGWSSTFLQTETVHALLSFLLAPALWLSGIPLPDVSQMDALRDASNLGREQASAAPWIHLYAVMLTLVVVLPRTLLALWSRVRAKKQSEHFPLPLDDSYFRGLLRAQRGDPTQVQVLPYGQAVSGSAEQHLRTALRQAFDDSVAIELAPTTTLGAEDDLSGLAPALAQATHLVVVFDMAATPEAEYHGAFLGALRAVTKAPVIVVVNQSAFANRFKDYPQRILERRDTWARFGQTIALAPQFLDLQVPQPSATVGALNSLIDELAEPQHG